MNQEQYIEHEVKIRIHDHKIDNLNKKLNWMIGLSISTMGLILSSIIIPIILHHYNLI